MNIFYREKFFSNKSLKNQNIDVTVRGKALRFPAISYHGPLCQFVLHSESRTYRRVSVLVLELPLCCYVQVPFFSVLAPNVMSCGSEIVGLMSSY